MSNLLCKKSGNEGNKTAETTDARRPPEKGKKSRLDAAEDLRFLTLRRAVIQGKSASKVAKLLPVKNYADARTLDEYDLLYYCVCKNNVQVMTILLEYGLFVDHVNEKGFTLLHIAALTRHPELVKCLLQFGADVNGQTKESKLSALHIAVLEEDVAILGLLLGRKGVVVDSRDGDGDTPLSTACKMGDKVPVDSGGDGPKHAAVKHVKPELVDIVKVLLAHGANVETTVEGTGKRPLHYAMIHDTMAIAQLLTDHGAEVNSTCNRQMTPLHAAVLVENQRGVEFMVDKGARVDGVNEEVLTPLVLASHMGLTKCVEFLLKKGANVNWRDKEQTYTPLAVAIIRLHDAIVELLIKKGADVNQTVKGEYTPLMLAARKGSLSIVRLLLDNGAKAELTSEEGRTALHVAVIEGHAPVVKMLLATEGASPRSSFIDAPEAGGNTPLMTAISKSEDMAMALIEAGANVHLTNAKTGDSTLMYALSYNLPDVARLLMEKGDDVNVVNDKSCTVLHIAIERNSLDMVKLLVSKGADVDVTLRNGVTLLHYACCFDVVEDIIALLVAQGLDVNAVAEGGVTPLDVASGRGHLAAVDVLLASGADVQVTNVLKRTPLHTLLAMESQYEYDKDVSNAELKKEEFVLVVKALVAKGVDVNVADQGDVTALQMAAFSGFSSVVKLLMDNGGEVGSGRCTKSHMTRSKGCADILKVLSEKDTHRGMFFTPHIFFNSPFGAIRGEIKDGAFMATPLDPRMPPWKLDLY